MAKYRIMVVSAPDVGRAHFFPGHFCLNGAWVRVGLNDVRLHAIKALRK